MNPYKNRPVFILPGAFQVQPKVTALSVSRYTKQSKINSAGSAIKLFFKVFVLKSVRCQIIMKVCRTFDCTIIVF